jgi:hypothetical protein
LEPGIAYSNRGVGYKSEESGYYEPGGGGSYEYSYGQNKTLHYLELPVVASGKIGNGFSVFAGPQAAFLLGAKTVNKANGQTTSTEKGKDGYKSVDIGMSAGVAYDLPGTFFSLSLGYYHGFSGLTSGSEYSGYGYNEPKYTTRSARLGIRYNVRAGRNNARSSGSRSVRNWLIE